jgi:hypothetical protein
MTRYGMLLGVFAVVFGLTVGGVAAGGFVLDDGMSEQPEINTSQWKLDNVAPNGAEDGGDIVMESSEQSNTLVVHVPPSTTTSGSPLENIPLGGTDKAITTGSAAGSERSVGALVSTLVANGHEVEFYGQSSRSARTSSLSDELSDADAFVTVGPTALSSGDRESLNTFADEGGRVFVGANPGQATGVVDFGSERGIYQSIGYLYNVAENDQNYLSIFAESTGSSVLTDGIDRVVFRGAAPIGVNTSDPVLRSETGTELTTTQRTDTYGVAAVDGNVTVVGDTSFLSPENAYRADNNVLIGNVADFLVTGTVNETVFEQDTGTQQPPVRRTG